MYRVTPKHPPVVLLLLLATLLNACAPIQPQGVTTAAQPQVLRLATTTSTADSGLLDAILPDFEQKFSVRVDVIAVGTGQALEIGAKGDVDVVLVHARAREDKFVADGDGVDRHDVMYNDFVVVGPSDDSAGITNSESAKAAFAKIAEAQTPFASRGDDSGTHSKEKSIWSSAGITPTGEAGWYLSVGRGMGETLLFSDEKLAYTLADRGTWLVLQEKLPSLTLLLGGNTVDENQDKSLRNPYGVIAVNPAKHPTVNYELATHFAEWLTSPETQAVIGDYGKEQFGQPLFYPSAATR